MKQYENINLLFIEDDINIRANYAMVFKDMFSNVYEAASYQEALNQYKTNDIDLMIVDINIKGIKTGIDFVKDVRKNDLNIKVIILSAYSTMENLLESTKLKLVEFLVKPVDELKLLETIEKAVFELENIDIINKEFITIKSQYKWDIRKKILLKDNKEVVLTKLEKEVLNTILINPSIELTHDILINNVWETYEKDHRETLRTIVSSLRKKLPKDTIQTLYGIGYRYK